MRYKKLPIIAIGALASTVLAQPTAFTYQGRLKNGAQPAAGLHDFRFRLWDTATGGAQLGATQCVDNLLLTEGLFTATIDFGQQFATPNQRFLEIEVRADTGLDCTNATGFTLLTPRQALSAAPLANHARSAFSLDAAGGSPANAVIVDNSGRVGIGTQAPTHTVHIAGTEPTLALQDTNSTTTQVGFISYRDSGNVERAWVGYGGAGDPDFSIVNTRPGGDIVLNPFSGNVGVGTSSPLSTLHVAGSGRFDGDVRLGPAGQYRAMACEENLRIVRGSVSINGAVVRGSGFSVTRTASGHFTVTFSTPFASIPSMTATPYHVGGDARRFAMLFSISASDAEVYLYHPDLTSALDSPFDFVAVGPR